MDEAQELKPENYSKEEIQSIKTLLKNIHNIKTSHGFMFLICGLGTTNQILGDYGISRFAGNSVINLNELDKVSERKIIWDWLVHDAGIDQHLPELEYWINRIQENTYQWPKHIVFIQRLHRILNQQGLEKVLELGKNSRHEYYEGRV